MDENSQDKTERKRMTTTDKKSLLPSSPKDGNKPNHPQRDSEKPKQPLIVIGISAAFVAVIVLIYEWFWFTVPLGIKEPLWVLISLILIGIMLLILLIRAGYTAQWTGFKGKTLWNWLDLFSKIAIPLVVLGATIGFGWWQVHLADLQHQTDLQIANDQQQETALQNYLDRMSDLLLNYNLAKSKPGDEVRGVARSRTLTLLPQLNSTRKREVLQFLLRSGLIHTGLDTIVRLAGADLSSTNLSFTNLSFTNLSGTYLTDAHLSFTNLSSTDLSEADLTNAILDHAELSDANLTNADLDHANLSGATLLDAHLSSAYLRWANLSGANLRHTDLRGANLTGANLSGGGGMYFPNEDINEGITIAGSYADLRDADLSGAHLRDADLSGAYLTNADLRDADLRGAHLRDADLRNSDLSGARGVTNEQLSEAKSLKGATLPDGSKHQ